MNKPVDLLYDEFVDSIAPGAILSKLKKERVDRVADVRS